MRAIVIPLLLSACVDLPEGWSDARPVDDLDQTACDTSGDPTEIEDPTFRPVVEAGDLTVELSPTLWRCGQELAGYYREDGDTLEVLVQPKVMKPQSVARCSCAYDVSATVDEVSPRAVRVFTRTDAYASEPTMTEVPRDDG